MGEKDIAEKTLLELDDVFADVFNVFYFKGNQLIRPKDLVSLPGMSAYTHDGKLRKQERDVVKLWKPEGVCLALYGIENQTRPDPDIALRLMGYDGAAYRSQLFGKDQKSRFPVITTVAYFGSTRWNAPKSLLERLTIRPELRPHVNDYKANVMEVAFLTPEEIGLFKSDFRLVADYFMNSRLDKNYRGSKEQINNVREYFQLMKVLTGDKRFDDVDFDALLEGEKNMYTIIDQWLDMGRAEGIATGRAEGIITGRAEGIITGRAEGIISGRNEGITMGITKGREEERASIRNNIQTLLNSGQITKETATLLLSNL